MENAIYIFYLLQNMTMDKKFEYIRIVDLRTKNIYNEHIAIFGGMLWSFIRLLKLQK